MIAVVLQFRLVRTCHTAGWALRLMRHTSVAEKARCSTMWATPLSASSSNTEPALTTRDTAALSLGFLAALT